MNKALLAVIAGIFIFSLIQMCSAMLGPEIRVEPSDINVLQDDMFTINITIDPAGSDEVIGAQYDLYFNNILLTAISQVNVSFLSQDGADTWVRIKINNTYNDTHGKLEYGENRLEVDYGVTTPGVLARITFKAIEAGTSNLNLSMVKLSDPFGQPIPGDVLVNNGKCDIRAVEQTLTPTPTTTPPSGGGDGGNGGVSVTPTPTTTPPSGGGDGGNGGVSVTPTQTPGPTPTPASTPTQISGLTPTQTSTITPVPSLQSSPTAALSPAPTASKSLPLSERDKRLAGFEVAFAVSGLLAIAYLVSKRKEEKK